MRLTGQEKQELRMYLERFLEEEHVLEMDQYVQHGAVSTLAHCRNVARFSFWLNRRLHLGADERALSTGALLHDFFLYDWHNSDGGKHRFHGFTHPGDASRNAVRLFDIGAKEQNIIESHMWPLTLLAYPKCREAVIVGLADKYCSAWETVFMRKRGASLILE